MGNQHAILFRESTIPGLSTAYSARSKKRRLIIWTVFFILFILTAKDLIQIITDYFHFPITVSVLVAESRVLPFPGVTVCNLNPVHRGRFCSSKEIEKPENVEKILCATLTDLFEVCKITESLKDLVDEGRLICTGSKSGGGRGKKGSGRSGRRSRNKGTATDRSEDTTKSYENEPDLKIEPAVIPGLNPMVKRIVQKKVNKFAAANNLTNMMPKDIFNPLVTRGNNAGTAESPVSISGSGIRGTGRRRGKREADEIKFNLRTLMSTFKALQAGNLSGGLLSPLTVSTEDGMSSRKLNYDVIKGKRRSPRHCNPPGCITLWNQCELDERSLTCSLPSGIHASDGLCPLLCLRIPLILLELRLTFIVDSIKKNMFFLSCL